MITLIDAADRVRAVQCRARALDDLDALDELRRDVLDGRGADRAGIDAQPVHQHQHVVRFRAAQEQRGLLAGPAEPRDLDARHEAQRIAEVRGGLPEQVVAGDDVDAGEDFLGGISVRVAVTTTGSSAGLPAAAVKQDQVQFIRAPPER